MQARRRPIPILDIPWGPWEEVTWFKRVACDGGPDDAVRFPDGSWEFIWNVETR